MASETSAPAPAKRRRWTKVLLLALLLAMAGAAGHRTWTGRVATKRLVSQFDEYVARGQPISAESLRVKAPRERNAAAFLREAAGWLKAHTSRDESLDNGNDSAAAEWVRNNQPAIEKTRAARAMPLADWGINPTTSAGADAIARDLADLRQLAEFLLRAAMVAHQQGDDSQALELLRDVLGIGRAIDQAHIIPAHLAADGLSTSAVKTLERIYPYLRIAGARTTAPATAPVGAAASSGQIRDLIQDLLDDEPRHRQQLAMALYAERAWVLTYLHEIAAGQRGYANALSDASAAGPLERAIGWWVFPKLQARAGVVAQMLTALAEAAAEPNWPAARANLPAAQIGMDIGTPLGEGVGRFFKQTLQSTVVEREYRAIAERRLAGVALALKLYRAETNERSADLGDLVPKYLPAIPADPYLAGGPLRMADRPSRFIYSAGPASSAASRPTDQAIRFYLRPRSTGTN